jgi:hypothetical protein
LIESAALEPTQKEIRAAHSLATEHPRARRDAESDWEPFAASTVEQRVWRYTVAIIAVSALVALLFASTGFVLGLLLGGFLALLNINWLRTSLKAVLVSGVGKAPAGTTLKFVFRWIVVGAAAYLGVLTGLFEPLGIILGLLAPGAAVIIEAGYVTGKAIRHIKGER